MKGSTYENAEKLEKDDMPTLNIAVSHRLTQVEAGARVQKLLGEVKTQYGEQISDLREAWEGDAGKFSFQAMGMPVSGTVTVTTEQVNLALQLPFAAMMFSGAIETVLRTRAEALLA